MIYHLRCHFQPQPWQHLGRSQPPKTGSKWVVSASLKMAVAPVGSDGAIQPTKMNALFHMAPVMTKFAMPQWNDFISYVQGGFGHSPAHPHSSSVACGLAKMTTLGLIICLPLMVVSSHWCSHQMNTIPRSPLPKSCVNTRITHCWGPMILHHMYHELVILYIFHC